MTLISKEQIQQTFEDMVEQGKVERYKKYGAVDARLAIPGEKITTVIDGEIETTNVANRGDVVVMNTTTKSREQYIITIDKFNGRYVDPQNLVESWGTFFPSGETDAFVWDGNSMSFIAPWGEEMIVHNGDYIARIPGTSDDIYRIARDEFLNTYTPVPTPTPE